MFHHEAWKLIYFEVKISKIKVTVTRHENVGRGAFVSAGVF